MEAIFRPGGPVSWQFRTTMRIIFPFTLDSGRMNDFGHSAQGNSRTPHLQRVSISHRSSCVSLRASLAWSLFSGLPAVP